MSSAKLIAFDCETYDPNLLTNGPGGIRKDGRLIGISVATDTGFRGYFPFGHAGEGNLNRNRVLQWAKDQLETPIDKVGANILYDLEWLKTVGINVKGNLYDIQVAEPLIDEERKEGYSLQVLSERYLGRGKDESLLQAAAQAYNIDPKKTNNLYVNTNAYAKENEIHEYDLWTVQMVKLFTKYFDVDFYRVCSKIIDAYKEIKNFRHITYEEFKTKINK